MASEGNFKSTCFNRCEGIDMDRQKRAFAATFNFSAKAAISTILNEPMRVITACTSIGGMIAAIVDYFSDKKFDGWIRV